MDPIDALKANKFRRNSLENSSTRQSSNAHGHLECYDCDYRIEKSLRPSLSIIVYIFRSQIDMSHGQIGVAYRYLWDHLLYL